MKRTPSKPPIVERRVLDLSAGSPRRKAAPATARPNRTWHADAPPREPDLPPDLVEDRLYQGAIDQHYALLRQSNDPDRPLQAAKTVARVEQLARNTASIHQLSHHNSAPAHILFARDHRTNSIIGKVLQALLPGVTYVKQTRPGDTRSPSSLARFVRTLEDPGDAN